MAYFYIYITNKGELMRKLALFAIAIALAFITTGCTASYERTFVTWRSGHDYAPARILVVTPPYGTYETIEYPTSGHEVVAALTKELKRYTNAISTVLTPVSINQLDDQLIQSVDYIIIPEILHWEDRATGWSMRPDRIEVRFDFYNNQRKLIDSYLITARSAYIVWISRQPNSLLPKPIRQMLTELFDKKLN